MNALSVLDKILKEIKELKQKQNSNNQDFCTGYISALSTVEGIISPMNNDNWIPIVLRKTTDEDGIDKEEHPFFIDSPIPENDQEILVTYKNGYVCTDTFYNDDGFYYLDSGAYLGDDVIAWMPKPKGYKGV